MRLLDLTGMRFGRWLVIGLSDARYGIHKHWDCRCDCGVERHVAGPSLRNGKSTSCGCWKDEKTTARATKHLMVSHPAYQTWSGMRARCSRPSHVAYRYYGARGIHVCNRWSTFEAFWEDMGSTWAAGLSLDRIDPDGNYEPANCRWATAAAQALNKRNTVRIETPWGFLTVPEASALTGLPASCIYQRRKNGRVGETLLAPVQRAN